jgi:hypothetical protein
MSHRPMLSMNARRSNRFYSINTSQETTISTNEGVPLEEVHLEVLKGTFFMLAI